MLKYSIKGSSLFKYGVWLRCDFIVFFLEPEMHDTPSTINNHFFMFIPNVDRIGANATRKEWVRVKTNSILNKM